MTENAKGMDLLIEKLVTLFDEAMRVSYHDKTFPSTVFGTSGNGLYKIVKDGTIYEVPNGLGTTLNVGQAVWVTMPCGIKNLKDMYISALRQ